MDTQNEGYVNNPSKVRCISIDEINWKKAKLVAYFYHRSISSLIKNLISECFRKNKKKIEGDSQ